MWNDTDIPLAYLITFRCYGTWLHGDERGSINRFRNQYKSHRLPANGQWLEINRNRMKHESITLNAEQRKVVEQAIRETCDYKSWHLQAINVRTNHIHAVVSIGLKKPETALNSFKANATRLLRQNNLWNSQKSPWANKGSKRYLWNEKSVFQAIDYVINGQGDDLPEFD